MRLLVPIMFLLTSLLSESFGQKVFKDENKNEATIKTIQIKNVYNPRANIFRLPVFEHSKAKLRLEFDVLQEDAEYYYAKIIHCNSDWTKSTLLPLQYINDFNEFPIEDYEFSNNTKVLYTHYKLDIPHLKYSGNYVIQIYPEGEENNILLSRRFALSENFVPVAAQVLLSNQPQYSRKKQRIRFSFNLKDFYLNNHEQQVHTVLYQNDSWERKIEKLSPTKIKYESNEFIYDPYTGQNEFFGGNEFRYFDLRSVDFGGINVARVRKRNEKYEAFLTQDESIANQSYSDLEDLNGSFVIGNSTDEAQLTNADYVLVHFNLKSEYLGKNKPVHVIGAFNGFKTDPTNKMKYYPSLGCYSLALLLKQGFYNYSYWTNSPENGGNYFLGNHYQTSNDYYIFVYLKENGKLYDRLISVKKVSYKNGRNQ